MTASTISKNVSTRRIVHRTQGHRDGPITRLISPGDLGELVKPFVFLDHFEQMSDEPVSLAVHPHSGIATHTTLLQGSIDYADSTGKSGILRPRSVEWMQAGGGVWHGGGPIAGERVRAFQLWIALPPQLELEAAFSDYVDADTIATEGPARILLGSYGTIRSTVRYREPVTYLHVKLRDGERWTYTPASHHDVAWLAVSVGALRVSGTKVGRELAVFEEGSTPIDVVADGAAELVVASATKHPYPLVTGRYSVHTNSDSLRTGEAGYAAIARTMKLVPGQSINVTR